MSSPSQAPQKKNKGRQKVKMQKMEKESNLQVTFSKRRAGLFKKASELCVLCAAETLIIVFSPARKAFSYGHPDVESVANRFLNGDTPDPTPTNASIDHIIMKATRNSKIRTKNLELTQLKSMLAMERKRAEELDVNKRIGLKEGWIPPPLEDFSSEQLKTFEKTVLNYQKHFDEEVAKFMSLNLNPTAGFNDMSEQYATGGINVTSNICSSVFDAFGFSDVAAGFNDKGSASHIGEVTVPSPPEFNNWTSGKCDTGVYATGETSVANNIGAPVSVPTEFTDWIPGFDNTGVYTGIENNSGAVSVQAEFDNWASGFFNTGGYTTGGTSLVNNGGAVSVQSELNDWQAGFNGTGVYTTGQTSKVGVQDPCDTMDLILDDLFTAPYNPNARGCVSDPFNLMTDDPSTDIFHGGSGPGVYPGFNDGGGPSQH